MPYTHKRPLVLCGTYIDTYMEKPMQLLGHEELRAICQDYSFSSKSFKSSELISLMGQSRTNNA